MLAFLGLQFSFKTSLLFCNFLAKVELAPDGPCVPQGQSAFSSTTTDAATDRVRLAIADSRSAAWAASLSFATGFAGRR